MQDFYEASREVGIRPFLMWGTLLGWVREGRFLRHDKDVDLGILASDYAKKDVLIAAMQKRGYRTLFDKAYKLRFTRPPCPLWIDVDVFYPWNGKMICSADKKDGKVSGAIFPPDAFRRLREIDFANDLKVLIPDPPEPVLEAIYGDWRTPVRHYNSWRDIHNRLLIPPGQPKPSPYVQSR